MENLKLITRHINKLGFIRVVDVSPRVIPTEFVDTLKCDYAIAEAARVSYSKGNRKVLDDASLIQYLYSHEHTSPFEMVTFKFHIKAPLFIVRQWQRHRMSSFNEISGRYSVIPESFWIPDTFRLQDLINRQSSDGVLSDSLNKEFVKKYSDITEKSYSLYKDSLEYGISREMARTILPQNMYTEFYWKIDLHNLLRFIKLRSAPNAQQEIREYSNQIKEIVKEYCPVTIKAYEKYTEKSIRFSVSELEIMMGLSSVSDIKSKSEQIEFNNKLTFLKSLKK